jgi:hypothetical protein
MEEDMKFDFPNSRGEILSGRLVPPESTPRAYALVTHSFTSMALKVERISLAKQGGQHGNRRKKYLQNRQRTPERLVPSIPGEPGQ